jgi:hypothetical protein
MININDLNNDTVISYYLIDTSECKHTITREYLYSASIEDVKVDYDSLKEKYNKNSFISKQSIQLIDNDSKQEIIYK